MSVARSPWKDTLLLLPCLSVGEVDDADEEAGGGLLPIQGADGGMLLIEERLEASDQTLLLFVLAVAEVMPLLLLLLLPPDAEDDIFDKGYGWRFRFGPDKPRAVAFALLPASAAANAASVIFDP